MSTLNLLHSLSLPPETESNYTQSIFAPIRFPSAAKVAITVKSDINIHGKNLQDETRNVKEPNVQSTLSKQDIPQVPSFPSNICFLFFCITSAENLHGEWRLVFALSYG